MVSLKNKILIYRLDYNKLSYHKSSNNFIITMNHKFYYTTRVLHLISSSYKGDCKSNSTLHRYKAKASRSTHIKWPWLRLYKLYDINISSPTKLRSPPQTWLQIRLV
ncbi:hypothetical protein ACJW31_01G057900 [Castanea mollissima]